MSNYDVIETEDVDTTFDVESDEVETVVAASPYPRTVKRGTLPEGYVTPVDFAKIITEKGLYFPRGSEEPGTLAPQILYSYINSPGKNGDFPAYSVPDSNNAIRPNTINVAEGLAWWEAKNKRTAERAATATTKAPADPNKPRKTRTPRATTFSPEVIAMIAEAVASKLSGAVDSEDNEVEELVEAE